MDFNWNILILENEVDFLIVTLLLLVNSSRERHEKKIQDFFPPLRFRPALSPLRHANHNFKLSANFCTNLFARELVKSETADVYRLRSIEINTGVLPWKMVLDWKKNHGCG